MLILMLHTAAFCPPPPPPTPPSPPPTLPQVPDVGEAMELGLKAATLISQKFPPPVKLEFEKVREGVRRVVGGGETWGVHLGEGRELE